NMDNRGYKAYFTDKSGNKYNFESYNPLTNMEVYSYFDGSINYYPDKEKFPSRVGYQYNKSDRVAVFYDANEMKCDVDEWRKMGIAAVEKGDSFWSIQRKILDFNDLRSAFSFYNDFDIMIFEDHGRSTDGRLGITWGKESISYDDPRWGNVVSRLKPGGIIVFHICNLGAGEYPQQFSNTWDVKVMASPNYCYRKVPHDLSSTGVNNWCLYEKKE
ncbi:MAG: hypothetical protein JW739_06235, partial [Opitutales bacterium]|nr:hypothetical protein [Opitutales bacterium]